jgi:hypothetical protein
MVGSTKGIHMMDVLNRAIEESKARDEIVHLDAQDLAGVSIPAACDELYAECEGSSRGSKVQEFWGTSVDGEDWRVHVMLPWGLTVGPITERQISALRSESGEGGDRAQVEICDRALDGDESARLECERVIRDAQAQ